MVSHSVAPALAPYSLLVVAGAFIHVAISYGPVYFLHVALLLWGSRLVLAIAECDRIHMARPSGLLEWSGLLFFAIYVASWIWARDRVHAAGYVGYMAIGAMVAVATAMVTSNVAGLKRFLGLAGTIVVAQIVVCLLEIATPFRLPISPFSPHAALFGRTDKLVTLGVSELAIRQALSSPTGFHWNPNNVALMMVIALPFFLLARNVLVRWTGISAVLVIIIASASRASLIGALLVLVVYAGFVSIRRLGITLSVGVPLLVLAVFLSTWFGFQVTDRLGNVGSAIDAATQLMSTQRLPNDSIGIRQQLMSNGVASIRETVGTGVGPGGSVLVQKAAGGAAARIGSMHNFWLEISVDAGVIALVVLAVWYATAWVTCISIAFYARDQFRRYVAAGLACALAGFALGLVSASSVLYFPPMWAMLGVVIGLRRSGDTRPGGARKRPVAMPL